MFHRLLLVLLSLAAFSTHAVVTPLPGVTPQRALALDPFPTPVAVRVTDDAGRPVAGVKAYFAQTGIMQLAAGATGECWVDFMIVFVCRATTDADGIARFPAMAARHAGTFTATVSATNDQYPGEIRYGETTLQFTAEPRQAPARIVVTAGNDQRAVIGTALAPITVRIEDASGAPRRQAVVWYSPTSIGPGGFELPPSGPAEVRTDDTGAATLPRLIAGWGVGAHEAEVRYFDPQAAAYATATIRYTATNEQGGLTLALGDLWWAGTAESGWGMTVVQRGDKLFNAWFVYDEQNRPTWFVQSHGNWSAGVGSFYEGPVYHPSGAPWHSYDASRFRVGPEEGRGSLNFAGPYQAFTSFFAHLGGFNPSFNKQVFRQPFGQTSPAPIQGVGDLWWGGPSQNGWGLAIHERNNALFMVWFTYGDDGEPTWFVMPGGTWSEGNLYSGTVYRTSGPAWTRETFDASLVQVTPVGTYRLRFASTQQARMEVAIEGRSVALELVRQPF